jgi:hypothetical protein
MNQSSFLRDLTGFLVGGVTAALATGFVFSAFHPMPAERTPHNHTPEVLAVLVIAMFFAGGFIGRRGMSADFYSDLLPSIIGTYLVLGFLCVIASLDFVEIAAVLGFVTVGVVTSVVVSLLLLRWFPPKIDHEIDT